MRRSRRRSDCPIHFGLEVFGDPWSLLIVRDLMFKGRTTYTDFLRAEEGIATNVLADRLALDWSTRASSRRSATARPGGRSASPDPKGIDLMPMLLDVIAWSAKYDPRTAAEPEFVERLAADRAGLETRPPSLLIPGITATPSSEPTPGGSR